MNNQKTTKITTMSMAIALVTVCTMVIRIPSINGYVNFGDIMIFIVASILGKRFGFIAGGFGSMFADLIGGYFIYMPATFIIKGLEGFIFGSVYERLKNNNTVVSLLIAGLIAGTEMFLGYFIYNYFMFGYADAIGSLIPGDIMQGYLSSIIAIPFVIAIKKTNFKLLNQE